MFSQEKSTVVSCKEWHKFGLPIKGWSSHQVGDVFQRRTVDSKLADNLFPEL